MRSSTTASPPERPTTRALPLEREFEARPEEAAADVERFVAELAPQGPMTLRRR